MEWIDKIIAQSDPSDREIALLEERPFNLITVVADSKGGIMVDDRCMLSGDIVQMVNPARNSPTDCWIVYGAYADQPDGTLEIDPYMYMDREWAYLSVYDDLLRASMRMKVARLAWTVAFGEVKDGKNIKNKCGQKNCIRPGHLKEALGSGSVWGRLSPINRRPTMLQSEYPQAEDELRVLPGPHLFWTGGFSNGIARVNRRGQVWTVRRYLYCCTHGKVPTHGRGGVAVFCDEPDCVSPFHSFAIMRGDAPLASRTLNKTDRFKYISFSQKGGSFDDLISKLKGPIRLMGVGGVREAVEIGNVAEIDPAWGVMLK